MRRHFIEDTNRELCRVLGEKFLTAENPTMVLNKYIGEVESFLSQLQTLYAAGSDDRNAIVKEAGDALREHYKLTERAIRDLESAEPEDVNEAREPHIDLYRINSGIPMFLEPIAGDVSAAGSRIIAKVKGEERVARILDPFLGRKEMIFLKTPKGYHQMEVIRKGTGSTYLYVLEFSKTPQFETQVELKDHAAKLKARASEG